MRSPASLPHRPGTYGLSPEVRLATLGYAARLIGTGTRTTPRRPKRMTSDPPTLMGPNRGLERCPPSSWPRVGWATTTDPESAAIRYRTPYGRPGHALDVGSPSSGANFRTYSARGNP